MATPLVSNVKKKVGFCILRIFKMIFRTSKCAHSIPGKISDRYRWSKNILKIFLSRKTFPKKSNEHFSTSALILYKGLIKSSMNRSLRIWSNPYIKSKTLLGKTCLGFRRDFLVMKIKYFASGFFLFARNFARGIQKCYLEHRAGIIKIRKMKNQKVLWKIRDSVRYSLPTLDPATIYAFKIKLIFRDF